MAFSVGKLGFKHIRFANVLKSKFATALKPTLTIKY